MYVDVRVQKRLIGLSCGDKWFVACKKLSTLGGSVT